MDHFFQIRSVGAVEEPMLEGMTTLGYAGALTSRARLGLMVGGIHYRQPGLWIKAATTLDVLTSGRAYLGIGAAWNQQESRALGFPMPPLRERFEWLEDTLMLAREMWQDELGSGRPVEGHHLHAERALNSPQVVSRPHPPIMVGGGGERRTLRLVAQYADACNVFGGPDQIAHKYEVLRGHCEDLGRDYASIERSNLATVSLSEDGAEGTLTPDELSARIGGWAEAGSQHVIFSLKRVAELWPIELVGSRVLPQVRDLGQPSPIA
jgi:alkanesulfonate monooxygenase SsuD/methylene tetrahydromethanopterin reductase-like flavin-dependent oxidoreductase (luciferase family)